MGPTWDDSITWNDASTWNEGTYALVVAAGSYVLTGIAATLTKSASTMLTHFRRVKK